MGKKKGSKKLLRIKTDAERMDDLLNAGFKAAEPDDNHREKIEKFGDRIIPLLNKIERCAIDSGSTNLSAEEIKTLDELIDALRTGTLPENLYDGLKDFIISLKTAYEILNVELIPNEQYQKLVKLYTDTGRDEPVPDYSELNDGREKKVTEFKTLANNLDKGYTVRDSDPYPVGVSKDNNVSMETFLRKVYSDAGLSPFDEIEIELSPKVDGVSVNTGIDKAKFKNPLSRGGDNGSILFKGFDNFQISNSPMVVNAGSFGAQFEAFMTFENREALVEKYGNEYSSNRGAASGTMMRSAKTETFDPEAVKFMSFYPIAVEGIVFKSNSERIEFLNSMYVGPNDMINRVVYKGNLENILKTLEVAMVKYGEIRESLSYSIDGIVITILDKEVVDIMGRSGRTNKFQIALKFEPGRGEGTVKGIKLSSGKKGFMSIMAVLEHPVAVNEKEFNEVLIGSIDKFNELDLHEGDRVEVVNTGDAMVSIAKLKKSSEGRRKIKLPETCPQCGNKLTVSNGKLSCAVPSCPAVTKGKMLNFLETLNIMGYSDKSIDKLYVGNIRSIYDLLTASDERYDGCLTNGHKLKVAIFEALKTANDANALVALSIVGLGNSTAEKILRKLSLEKLCTDFNVYEAGEAAKTVPGLGDSVFRILEEIQKENKTLKEIAKYITKIVVYNDSATRVATTKVSSDTIKALKKLVGDDVNYKLVDNKAFDVLVVDDYDVKSGKVKAAQDKGLKPKNGIYTLRDFEQFVTSGKTGEIENEQNNNNIDNEGVVNSEDRNGQIISAYSNFDIGLENAFRNVSVRHRSA